MAITINSSPSAYQSINDKNWWVVTSTNTSETNFKYVCDIYVASNLVARLKSFPNPNNNKGIFDVANVIKNYLANYFLVGSGIYDIAYDTSNIYVSYEVKFGEEYGGTTYLNLTTATKTAYNYIADLMSSVAYFNATQYDDYPTQFKFLTKRDLLSLKTTRSASKLFIPFLSPTQNVSADYQIWIDTYSNGTQINTDTGDELMLTDLAQFDFSISAINEYVGYELITSSIDAYVIRLILNETEVQQAKVTIVCESKFTPIPLHFLNSLGGYETMVFDLVNKQNRSLEKKSFEQYEWEYNSSSTSMDRTNQYGVLNGGSKTFWNQQSVTYHLISDYVTLTDYTWLRDLLMSPEVYTEINGVIVPVTMTTNTWNEKKRYTDKVYNLELDIELASKVNGQAR